MHLPARESASLISFIVVSIVYILVVKIVAGLCSLADRFRSKSRIHRNNDVYHVIHVLSLYINGLLIQL